MTSIRHMLVAAVWLFGSTQAVLAEDAPVVVELFTSQGCSSCPPADAVLEELSERPDVIALALHVDYWDYLGWRDEFANPAFTTRQQNYAAAAGAHTIYTPQFVIGGVDHVVGAKTMEIMDRIQGHRSDAPRPDLTVAQDASGALRISAPKMTGIGVVRVQLVTYLPRRQVQIGRGENAGREMVYVNIVTSWRDLGAWDGSSDLALTAPFDAGDHGAVLLQDDGFGKIVAAQLVGQRP